MNIEQIESALIKRILPYIALCFIFAIAITLLVVRYVPIGLGGAPTAGPGLSTIYVFDVVKFTNAQRKVASSLLRKEPGAEEAGLILLNVSKMTRQTIEEITGPDATILIKQSVIQGRYVDITEQVMAKLGLPLDVPTASTDTLVIDSAPTNLVLRGLNKPIERPADYYESFTEAEAKSKELVP